MSNNLAFKLNLLSYFKKSLNRNYQSLEGWITFLCHRIDQGYSVATHIDSDQQNILICCDQLSNAIANIVAFLQSLDNWASHETNFDDNMVEIKFNRP